MLHVMLKNKCSVYYQIFKLQYQYNQFYGFKISIINCTLISELMGHTFCLYSHGINMDE